MKLSSSESTQRKEVLPLIFMTQNSSKVLSGDKVVLLVDHVRPLRLERMYAQVDLEDHPPHRVVTCPRQTSDRRRGTGSTSSSRKEEEGEEFFSIFRKKRDATELSVTVVGSSLTVEFS